MILFPINSNIRLKWNTLHSSSLRIFCTIFYHWKLWNTHWRTLVTEWTVYVWGIDVWCWCLMLMLLPWYTVNVKTQKPECRCWPCRSICKIIIITQTFKWNNYWSRSNGADIEIKQCSCVENTLSWRVWRVESRVSTLLVLVLVCPS